jgi:hypothetical protein
MAVALFPGAFKPPTKGHFLAVKELATNTFKAAKWDSDQTGKITPGTLRSGEAKDKVDTVVVIISNKARNGISAEDSLKVWNIYKKYLPGNVDIIISPDADPIRTALQMVKQNPDKQFINTVYLRTEKDYPDLSRIKTFEKYPNSKGLALKSELEGVRATDLRNAVITNSFDLFKQYIPEELSQEEAQLIFNMVKSTVKAEQKLFEEMGSFFDNMFVEEEKEVVKEGNSGTPISARGTVSAADRQRLVVAYHRLVDVLGDKFYDIKFNQDHIRVQLPNEDEKIGFDYTPYMGSILEYMLEEKMNITPLPEVKIKRDPVESADFFGKTAYYDPNVKEITLYVQGRHPKDVMRSFVHEMIHHIQNLEGRIKNINTTNVNEDEALVELEKEAYMLGNMTFRSWSDKVKNG